MRTLTLRPALALALLLPALAGAAGPAARGAGAARGVVRLGPEAPASPRRVVSLAPSLTDLAVAMGLGPKLVGVTRYDDAPEVKGLPRVGGFLDPSPEAVVALRPDLVLWMTDGGALPAVERIASLGIPVLAFEIVSVADLLASAHALGAALGDSASGARVAGELRAKVEQVRSRAARLRPVRVLFVVGRDPLVVAGPGSYPDEVLGLVGAVNVATGARPWPIYPLEKAVADGPEVVVDGAVLEPAEGIRRLAAVPAVRAGRVVRMKDDGALRPGPKLAATLDALLAALHPEAR